MEKVNIKVLTPKRNFFPEKLLNGYRFGTTKTFLNISETVRLAHETMANFLFRNGNRFGLLKRPPVSVPKRYRFGKNNRIVRLKKVRNETVSELRNASETVEVFWEGGANVCYLEHISQSFGHSNICFRS